MEEVPIAVWAHRGFKKNFLEEVAFKLSIEKRKE